MGILFLIISVLCACYTVLLISYDGIGTVFLIFWPLAAVGFFLLFVGYWKNGDNRAIPKQVLVPAYTLALTGLFLFIIVTIKVLSGMGAVCDKDSDYLVVLGCQIQGEEPSPVLRDRLDTAIEYLEEHPDTTVIVSGGLDEKQGYTEASVMAAYLKEQGIEAEQILVEDRSHNTTQNLLYSKDFMEDDSSVVIVTSNFHVTRAGYLAKNLGYKQVEMIAAPSDGYLILNYTVRECFAILYEKLIGII